MRDFPKNCQFSNWNHIRRRLRRWRLFQTQVIKTRNGYFVSKCSFLINVESIADRLMERVLIILKFHIPLAGLFKPWWKKSESVPKRETRIVVISQYWSQKNTLGNRKGRNDEENHRFVPGAVSWTPMTLSVFTFSIQILLRVSNIRKFDYVHTTMHAHAVFYIIIQYYI